MKFIKRIFVAILAVVLIVTTTSCDTTPKRDASEFDDFSRQVLELVIGSDELSINFFFKNPENFGLEHGEPYLPVPSSSANIIGNILINTIIGQVDWFDMNELTFDQQMTANVIKDLLDTINNQVKDEAYLDSNYLGSYLGYQAQLPILLLRYNFREEADIVNYFKFLDLVPETFKTYVEFEIEKADNGYGMPDFVIDNVVNQCEGFLTNIDSEEELHFMISGVNNKIDECDFLTSDLKTYYKELNASKVRGPLKEGYKYVFENLPALKGRATNNMGLAHYVGEDGEKIGKNFYTKIFQEAVGYDVSVEDALLYVEEKLVSSYDKVINLSKQIKNDPTLLEEYNSIEFMTLGIEEQLDYYKNNLQDLPEISDSIVVTIDYVDESIEDHFSPAAYFVSAVDEHVNEFIILNRSEITYVDEQGNTVLDTDYLSTTLAHEGYPGHLYQNVYFKNTNPNLLRLLLGDLGYKEGWAKYSERLSLDLYFDKNNTSDDIRELYYEELNFEAAFYTKLDIGIHYLGWTIEEMTEYVQSYYQADDEKCIAIYQQLVEIPTNYPTYFYTYLKIVDLVNKTNEQGISLYDFHKAFLDCGPVPLKYVEEHLNKTLFN